MSDKAKLKKFGELAAAGLSETINSLLGREVHVGFSQVDDFEMGDLLSSLGDSSFCSVLKGSGGVDGPAFLLIKEKDASILSDILIGQDGTNAPDKMTELHLSAFGEVVHQIIEVFNKEVKQAMSPKALWVLDKTAVKKSSELSNELSQLVGPLVVVSFGLFVQDLLSGNLLFCFSEFVEEGEKPGAAMPVGNVQSGVSSGNIKKRVGGGVMSQLENESRSGGNIGLLMDVPLKLTVELGRTTRMVKEILALAPGAVVELDKLSGEAVDILVNEKLIAKGEVVVIDENFGVRITEILNPEERLTAVQG